MGCNSSVNIQVEENNGNRIIKANDRIIENKNKTNNNNISQKKNKFDDDNAEYMDIDTAKKTLNENSESKVLENNTIKISKIQNLNINKNLYNYKSTNFKYEKDNQKNLLKSNPVLNENNQNNNNDDEKYIQIKHPLDSSSSEKEADIEKNKEQEIDENKVQQNNINVLTSMEQRINNYKGENDNNRFQDDEDAVNTGNLRDEENDDMCNLGQSMNFENKNNISESKNDITIIFEIQSTGEKYNINTNQDVKLNDLIEKFKKKIDLSPFEKPEFMYNGIYLIDTDKSIIEYNIKDKSKLNVYI